MDEIISGRVHAVNNFEIGSSHDIKILTRRAEASDADAQVELGNAYAEGDAVAKSYTKSAHWHRRAAEQGSPEGQVGLGACYYLGRGVKPDPEEALRWCRSGADGGCLLGLWYLGLFHFAGVGFPKTMSKRCVIGAKLRNRGMPRPVELGLELLRKCRR